MSASFVPAPSMLAKFNHAPAANGAKSFVTTPRPVRNVLAAIKANKRPANTAVAQAMRKLVETNRA